MDDFPKVAYIEGRPASHPTHAAYAKSVDAVFHFVDFKLRYHDVADSSAFRRYLSWLLCAFTFPQRKGYDVFLSEEAYFMLGLMKLFGLLSKKQKLIGIMGSHTLYFLHSNRYKPSTKKAFIKLFNKYDAFICEGPLQYEMLSNMLGKNSDVRLYKIFNGSPVQRFSKLIQVEPQLTSMNIITIGAMPNNDRIYYKGFDLMLEAFSIVKKYYPALTFTVVGEYDHDLMTTLTNKYCPDFKADIIFTGQISDLTSQLNNASLYLHTARGEAWGISVTEAMSAGIPPIVSDWTGSKEAVEKISEKLVVPLQASLISDRVIWYLGLSVAEKKILSEKAREVSRFYTEENAIAHFKKTFEKAYIDCTT
jgi:glycosyltransferase involved in cell wall biosynthesis